MLRLIRMCAVPAFVVLLAGCGLDEIAAWGKVTEDFSKTFNQQPGGHLYVRNFNGSVEVLAWEKPEVQITGTKYARDESDLKRIRIDMTQDSNGVRIQSLRPSERDGNMGVKYVIRAPNETILDEVSSSNGAIRIEQIRGNMTLRTSNGAIRLQDLKGRISARTSNGAVEANGIDGDVDFDTSNGSITVSDLRGAALAETSNGAIRIDVDEPPQDQPYRLSTSNGAIELKLPKVANNEVRLKTSNGGIALTLPPSVNARIDADAGRSGVHTDFPLETSGTSGKGRLEGTLGSGGPLIELRTSNSKIQILKGMP